MTFKGMRAARTQFNSSLFHAEKYNFSFKVHNNHMLNTTGRLLNPDLSSLGQCDNIEVVLLVDH